jgi:hypothetical protein
MQLTYVAVVILASMIFVLSGMVGYVYWQQTRMLQNLQSLALVFSTHFVHAPPDQQPQYVEQQDAEMPPLVPVDPVPETIKEEEEDDRVSVDEKADVVEGPPAAASESVAAVEDELESKTAAQLRDLLTAKGIPFGKRDAKTVLVKLLKATA